MGLIKKEFIVIDPSTGERREGFPVWIPIKPKLKEGFFIAMQEGFLRLARESDLTGEDLKVLLAYLGNLDFENYLQISQQAIADDLKIGKTQVSRATKKLVDKGILIKGSKTGKHYTYGLNTFYGWKGKVGKKYTQACEEGYQLV